MTEAIRVEVTTSGPVTIVSVFGEIDIATAPTLRAATDTAIAQGPPHVIMDLGGVEFIDSSGLAVVTGTAQQLGAGSVAVVVHRAHIRRVFAISGVDQLLPVCGTVAAALNAVAAADD
jgi:anti-sigma B factor antagonist